MAERSLEPERRTFDYLTNSPPKLTCPACEESNSRVVDSRYRAVEDAIVRQRKCLWCGKKFETTETVRRRAG
jgi:hypothetical protein